MLLALDPESCHFPVMHDETAVYIGQPDIFTARLIDPLIKSLNLSLCHTHTGCNFSYRIQKGEPQNPYKPLDPLIWTESP